MACSIAVVRLSLKEVAVVRINSGQLERRYNMRSDIRIVEHRDGDEFIFRCPKCNKEMSIGSWTTTLTCGKCLSTINIVVPRPYAEVIEED